MAIIFKLDAQGGFTCADTKTGRTSYAYPTSDYANLAKVTPKETATEMMKHENECGNSWRNRFKAQDAERMNALLDRL